MVAAAFRVGLRVTDVDQAARFYRGFGFDEVGTVPDPEGRPVMTILQRGEVHLIVDALRGMPFADSERERQTQAGPRGLGVAIGLGVDDLDASYEYCRGSGCTITCEPMDEAWGDRVFECVDPFGYVWEFSQPIADGQPDDGFAAVREKWFPAAQAGA
ncbi:VOC family protein [Plantactinospora soyae]|uniref:Glyoxalase superfamily protein PhnB n=1 Tax=Plantactinospora soyae TaxID=1544732 RepID=A0A927RAY9_9ACTN|nr:VOC family protein [Plantactinospora soyae]MBE1492824.1 putative glyoxalase superfamily protein PhnB [Plantactinospora soyae]